MLVPAYSKRNQPHIHIYSLPFGLPSYSGHLCACSVAQSCLNLCNPIDGGPPGSSVHGIFPGRNTGVGCYFLFQRICPTQGSNSHLLSLLASAGGLFTTEPPGKPYPGHHSAVSRVPCAIQAHCSLQRINLGPKRVSDIPDLLASQNSDNSRIYSRILCTTPCWEHLSL